MSGLFLAATYALAAFGLAIVFGVLHILNFAHGSLLLLGAYLAVELTQLGLAFWLAAAAGILAIGLLGLGLERVLFRRVEQEPMAGLIISIGLIAIVETVILQVWGPDPYELPRLVDGSLAVGNAHLPYDRLLIIAIAAVSLGLAQLAIARAGWGKLLRATAEDRDAAALQGVPVSRVRAVAFALGAALAAFAGIVIGTTVPVEPVLGEAILINAFVIIIIGGVGSTTGTLVGALIIGMTEALGVVYLPTAVAQLAPLVVLSAVLLMRPQGVLGRTAVRV